MKHECQILSNPISHFLCIIPHDHLTCVYTHVTCVCSCACGEIMNAYVCAPMWIPGIDASYLSQ